MRSSFNSNSIKTAFQYRSDSSLTTSFSTLINTLPPGTASVTALNDYKVFISTKNYRGSYKRTILGIVDRLIDIITNGVGTTIHSFDTVRLATNIKLTVNSVYQDYLDGLNDGNDIDPVMLIILNEIKSASIA